MAASSTAFVDPAQARREMVWGILRVAGGALLLAVAITGSGFWAWFTLPGWLLIGLTSFSMRRTFELNLMDLRCVSTPDAGAGAQRPWPGVTLIAPARNEEEGIEPAVQSMAGLRYPDLEVIVVNDHSTDRTGAILEDLAREFPRLRLLQDPPLQEGWLGKANAIWYAVQQGNAANAWLVLTDADVVFNPEALHAAVAHAEEHRIDFLTCLPLLDTGTCIEEIMGASGGWPAIVMYADRKRLSAPGAAPLGIGAFILVRRKAYLESGGHAAFPDRQPEDQLLAETVKAWGGKCDVACTPDLMRVRQYRGLRQLVRATITKARVNRKDNAAFLFSDFLFTLLSDAAPLPLAILGVVHQVLEAWFSLGLTVFSIAALLAYLDRARTVSKAREIVVMRRIVPWLHPIAGLVRACILLAAIVQALTGSRMSWRGRPFANPPSHTH